jgi:hypothetical protein
MQAMQDKIKEDGEEEEEPAMKKLIRLMTQRQNSVLFSKGKSLSLISQCKRGPVKCKSP